MGSFSGKMEMDVMDHPAAAAAVSDRVVWQCCRYGPCCHHGSPLAVRGQRLTPQLKPNIHDKQRAAAAAVKTATNDDHPANIGESK